MNITSLALESEDTSGVKKVEIEYTIYARIADFSVLERAKSMEYQEQWEIKLPKVENSALEGRFRIRASAPKGQATTYAQTLKVKHTIEQATTGTQNINPAQNTEITTPSTVDAFHQFKLLSPAGMVKERYIYDVAGLPYQWEVDVFILPDGKRHEWCKIDLEVDQPLAQLPGLPPGFRDAITNQTGKRTFEEEHFVRTLYDNVFITKNQFA
jgi:hypothetical protein